MMFLCRNDETIKDTFAAQNGLLAFRMQKEKKVE